VKTDQMTDSPRAEPDIRRGQSFGQPPGHRPAGVRPISLEGLSSIGVRNDGRLFWHGKPVEVGQAIRLTRLQLVIAIVAAFAALASTIATSVSAGISTRELPAQPSVVSAQK